MRAFRYCMTRSLDLILLERCSLKYVVANVLAILAASAESTDSASTVSTCERPSTVTVTRDNSLSTTRSMVGSSGGMTGKADAAIAAASSGFGVAATSVESGVGD